ncbi:MAG: DUF302 domain-containing protein [Deltaproteobacteria bacterium]|nr:DUF302 domain-containing protein [Deltaproteobacteria bacterium]
MYEREYAITRVIDDKTVAEVSSHIRDALNTEGFGVLTEIDVQATLKKKLNVDRKPYLILGVCNPSLANRALEAEPPIGVFLPCNVNVYEGDDGAVYVQTPKPTMMFGLVDNPSIKPIAEEVETKLKRVIEKL